MSGHFAIVSCKTRAFPPSGWLCTYELCSDKVSDGKTTTLRVNRSSDGRWSCDACSAHAECQHIQLVRMKTKQRSATDAGILQVYY